LIPVDASENSHLDRRIYSVTRKGSQALHKKTEEPFEPSKPPGESLNQEERAFLSFLGKHSIMESRFSSNICEQKHHFDLLILIDPTKLPAGNAGTKEPIPLFEQGYRAQEDDQAKTALLLLNT
jgi:hypothetical protein